MKITKARPERHVVKQPRQKGLIFYADKRQAKIVFGALLERLRARGIPYNSALVPQTASFTPINLKKGSREHALFLFMLCLWMRGGVESDVAARFLKNMHEGDSEFFNPDRYLDPDDTATQKQIAEVTEVLKKYQLGQRVEENAVGWVYNMRKLARFWKGDPRMLMNDKPKFNTLTKRIIGKTGGKKGEPRFKNEEKPQGFMYFREKMVAMIAYFLMDAKLVPMFYTPVPVDFHVLRLLTTNQILRVKGKDVMETIGIDFMCTATLKEARMVTEWYCRKHKVSPIALTDALWLLSRSLCRNNPGNSGYVMDDGRKSRVKEAREKAGKKAWEGMSLGSVFHRMDSSDYDPPSESSESDTPKGRKRYQGLKWDEHTLWKSRSRINRFERTCAMCPVRSHCKFNISAGAYYVSGNLLPERLRLEPPDGQGHFFGHAAFKETLHVPIHPEVRFAEIGVEE